MKFRPNNPDNLMHSIVKICPFHVSGSPPAISRQTLHSAAADQKGSKQAAPSTIIGGGGGRPLGNRPNPDQAGAPSSSPCHGRILVAQDPDAGPGGVGHRAEPAAAAAANYTSGQHGDRKVDGVYPLVVVFQSFPRTTLWSVWSMTRFC